MLARLVKFFQGQSTTSATPPVSPPANTVIEATMPAQTGPRVNGEPVPVYPDPGSAVPAASPDDLLATQATLIAELQQTSALSHEDFDRLIRPLLRNYAAFVHLLPASEAHHHSGIGGLFRHGLEAAYYATRKCEGAVFALDHTPQQRKRLEPRWRIAALIGGLLHDVGKPIVDVGAIDTSGGIEWNPHVSPLYDWLVQNKLSHYYIHWRAGARFKRHEAFTTAPIYRIVPQTTMQWLADHGGHEAIDAMMMALFEGSDPRNPLISIIKSADSNSVSRDITDARTRLAASGLGGVRSLAARLVRTIHDQIASGEVKLNQRGHAIWITTEGVFGIFPAIATQALEGLREMDEKGVPLNSQEALRVLSDHGYLVPNIQANAPPASTWNIVLHAEERGNIVPFPIQAVRFLREEILPTMIVRPAPIKVDILDHNHRPVSGGGTVGGVATPAAPTAPEPQAEEKGTPTSPPAQTISPITTTGPEQITQPISAKNIKMSREEIAEEDIPVGGEDLEPSQSTVDTTVSEAQSVEAPPEAVEIRDRRDEGDRREERLRAVFAEAKASFPPTTLEGARDWFREQSVEGLVFLTIEERLSGGALRVGIDVVQNGNHIYLRFPEALANLAAPPPEMLALLEKKTWIDRDPATPKRATVALTHNGRSLTAIKVNQQMSSIFGLMLSAVTKREPASSGGPSIDGPYLHGEQAALISDRALFYKVDSPVVRTNFHRAIVDEIQRIGTGEELDPKTIRAVLRQFSKDHRLKDNWLYMHLTDAGNPILLSRGEFPDRKGDAPVKPSHSLAILSINPSYDLTADKAVVAAMLGSKSKGEAS